ncbi:MAG: cytochrome C oxidase subunit IV family protein [SAR202 cluster bacterium]|nr:cytochrome C oxidase subunit IV family protein [SAR202 cluster bacterium]
MAHQTEHTTNHPSTKQYVTIAIILFAITIVEFLLIWDRVGIADDLGASKIPLLVALSAVKFAIVILFYMHLKFDNPFFLRVFVAGLTLAFLVGIAVISLFVGFEGKPRTFAQNTAVPYEEHAEKDSGEAVTGETGAKETDTPIMTGPVTLVVGVAGETLGFDTQSITAASGAEVTISVTNPSANNSHNLVIVKAGTKDAVAADGTAAGPTNDWVTPGDSRVIAHTKLLTPGVDGEVTFTAPAPGTYQFVCTFPGHNFTMFGDFVVN